MLIEETIYKGVVCDDCGAELTFPEPVPIDNLCSDLKDFGWLTLQLGKKHYCPKCYNKGKEYEKALEVKRIKDRDEAYQRNQDRLNCPG